jgi:short-subunit dehydrogenase
MTRHTEAVPRRQKILITGASSGLGAQLARDFAAMGRDLALCARRTERLEAIRDELATTSPGSTVTVHQLDVRDHDQVFEVVEAARKEHGGLDRVVVNAGIGMGQPIGTGRFDANLQTAQTNFVAALAQCEAAMNVFREQGYGHLVVVSSVSAVRGLPRNATTYAATKAGISALAEGIRAEVLGTPIVVTTLQPGFIRSELTEGNHTPLIVSTEKGVAAMVAAIEKEKATAYVPGWPWAALAPLLRHVPLRLIGRFA